MIKDGDFTIIGGETFHVVKTDDAFAYLKQIRGADFVERHLCATTAFADN